MTELELLVVGTGRSGTGFLSKVLTEAGLPCSHEGRFGPRGLIESDDPAESSWLAVPYLEVLSVPTVLVWRDPIAVVRSLLGIRFFETPGPYRDFALRHEPDLEGLPVVRAALEWWIRWNRRALDLADVVLDVGRPRWGELADLEPAPSVFALEGAAQIVGTSYNSRERADSVPLDELDGEILLEADELVFDLERRHRTRRR